MIALLAGAWLALSAADDTRAALCAHLRELAATRPAARAALELAEGAYRDAPAESLALEALARVYPEFAAVLDAFDRADAQAVCAQAPELLAHGDAYVVRAATYLYARALTQRGRFEEAARLLAEAPPSGLFAAHLEFLRACCEARTLEREPAMRRLEALAGAGPEVPPLIAVSARQLLLELRRVAPGSLDEVAAAMDYVAGRLAAADPSDRVRQVQERIVALLDRLIEQQEQNESRSGGAAAGDAQGAPGGMPGGSPAAPREESVAPPGEGRIGRQHAAPPVQPGDMWGKLPPAERERILHALQGRFPSRYRQLVEQYYRALAEEPATP